MKAVVFFLIGFFVLFSSSSFSQKDSLSFLALGDSYTVGTSELYEYSWPVVLKQLLLKKEIYVKEPQIIAGAGWTSDKLIEVLKSRTLTNDYDIVSLMIGVNNQYRNQNFSAFKNDFVELLNQSIVLAKNDVSKVLVLSIPDWSLTPFARFKDKEKNAKEIKAYNKMLKNETKKREVLFIDITKISQQVLFDKSLLAKDSLHPSRKMHKAWARKISKELNKKY